MFGRNLGSVLSCSVVLLCAALPCASQSFQVQCPTSTITHPTPANVEPAYTGPTALTTGSAGYMVPAVNAKKDGQIKCQQISGGDGFSAMRDGPQTSFIPFSPLSGLKDIADRQHRPQFPNGFNTM